MKEIERVCVLGERVSGTSFLEKLLTENTSLISVLPYNHKHFFQDINLIRKSDTRDTLFIFISRDIIEWLNSFLVNTFHADKDIRKCKSMNEFIRKEWKCVFDATSGTRDTEKHFGKEMMFERNPSDGKRFSNVIQMRNAKMKHFLSLKNEVENFLHLKYEDVRDSPKEYLEGICEMFNIPMKNHYREINTVRGKGRIPYKRKLYPALSEQELDTIMENIDTDLEKELSYL